MKLLPALAASACLAVLSTPLYAETETTAPDNKQAQSTELSKDPKDTKKQTEETEQKASKTKTDDLVEEVNQFNSNLSSLLSEIKEDDEFKEEEKTISEAEGNEAEKIEEKMDQPVNKEKDVFEELEKKEAKK